MSKAFAFKVKGACTDVNGTLQTTLKKREAPNKGGLHREVRTITTRLRSERQSRRRPLGHSRRPGKADDNREKAVRPRQWRYYPPLFIHIHRSRAAGLGIKDRASLRARRTTVVSSSETRSSKALLRKKNTTASSRGSLLRNKKPRGTRGRSWLKQPHSTIVVVVRTTHAPFTCELFFFFFLRWPPGGRHLIELTSAADVTVTRACAESSRNSMGGQYHLTRARSGHR